jgi:hypothetical protein
MEYIVLDIPVVVILAPLNSVDFAAAVIRIGQVKTSYKAR